MDNNKKQWARIKDNEQQHTNKTHNNTKAFGCGTNSNKQSQILRIHNQFTLTTTTEPQKDQSLMRPINRPINKKTLITNIQQQRAVNNYGHVS